MTTVLFYLVIASVIGLVIFFLAVFVFGRGEQMAPLDPRTSPAELPDHDISSDDVRRIRFALALRGYRMSDVDWTLERLGEQIDDLRRENVRLKGALPDIAGDTDTDTDTDADTGDFVLEAERAERESDSVRPVSTAPVTSSRATTSAGSGAVFGDDPSVTGRRGDDQGVGADYDDEAYPAGPTPSGERVAATAPGSSASRFQAARRTPGADR